VRDFYPEPHRQAMISKIEGLIANKKSANWQVTNLEGNLMDSDVDTIGIPLNMAIAQHKVQEYFDNSLASTRQWRDQLVMSPIDKLRLELDEVHPTGCQIGRDGARLHAAGLVRIMKRSMASSLVHIDDVGETISNIGTFSANIYLQTAMVGGEVEIWPVSLPDKETLMDNAQAISLLTTADVAAQAALKQHVLPLGPTLIIKPKPGDLLLLCVQRPHCVRGPIHGPHKRLSFQTFVVNQSPQHALKVEV